MKNIIGGKMSSKRICNLLFIINKKNELDIFKIHKCTLKEPDPFPIAFFERPFKEMEEKEHF